VKQVDSYFRLVAVTKYEDRGKKPKMTHKERILRAINHQEPDRVPIDLGSTKDTSIVIQAYQKLKKYIGFEETTDRILERMTQVADVEETILNFFDVDCRGVFLGAPDKVRDVEVSPNSYMDEWGVIRTKPEGCLYYDITTSPLSGEITISDIVHFKWPDPYDPGRTRGLEESVTALKEKDCAIVLNLPGAFVHVSQYLRGFYDWYCDCAMNTKILEALFDAVLEVHLAICSDALTKVGSEVHLIFTGDDLGNQKGPSFSPDLYRRVFKPRHKKFLRFIHDHSDAKVIFHTCGSVYPLLADLIDAGVDVLNPVQVSARNMDSALLKKHFGDKLCFWGGIDIQHVLNQGSTVDVKAEVRRRIDDLAPGGGYVLCAAHNIQPDVPPENIVAMYNFAHQYAAYR
jgi:uroporphyrinogen decarboxylase